jgi:hypothetical protein
MRPATTEEQRADAVHPRYRHVELQAAQIDRNCEREDDDPLAAAPAGDAPERPSWLGAIPLVRTQAVVEPA